MMKAAFASRLRDEIINSLFEASAGPTKGDDERRSEEGIHDTGNQQRWPKESL